MHLKIVLHIKIQFVSSDLMVVNKTHLKRHARNGHCRLPSATLWSFDPTAGTKGSSKHHYTIIISVYSIYGACYSFLLKYMHARVYKICCVKV